MWQKIRLSPVGFGVILTAAIYLLISLGLLLSGRLGLGNAEVLSLGQLCVEALLLPVAIVGFAITMNEFRKAQAKPDLRLRWDLFRGESGEELNTLAMGPPEEEGHAVLISNSGNSVAAWYLVELEVPYGLCLLGEEDYPKPETWEFDTGIMGGNWLTSPPGLDGFTVTFMSNGQIGVYPGHSLRLGTLWLIPYADPDKYSDHVIPFKIYSDRADPVRGALKVRIEGVL